MINYSVGSRTVNGETKYYAYTQIVSLMSFDEFCKHIADHGSVYRKSDIMGVLTVMVKCLKEQALNGKKIEVGDLGSFRAKAKCAGAESYAAFDSSNFTKLTMGWTPGDLFDDMIDDATFNQVLTQSQAASVAAALANDETSASLTEEETTESTESSDTSGEEDNESV